MRGHRLSLISWLLTTTVLLSLVGFTANPLPAAEIGASQIEVGDAEP